VRGTIYATFQLLISFPNLGRRQAVEGVRKVVTRRYSYLIYYRVDETVDELVVLGVRHPAQGREYSDR
jgi:toxin ParE1/3/4